MSTQFFVNRSMDSDSGLGSAPARWSRNGLFLGLLSLYFVLLCVLALPLLEVVQRMQGKPYYDHTPLLVIAASALAAYRQRQYGQSIVWRMAVTPRVCLWTLLAVGLTTSVFVLPSRWASCLAVLTTMASAIRLFGGPKLARLFAGPMWLLIVAIPLPLGFDAEFVVALQRAATWLASGWLEISGIMHLASGVSVETLEQDYFVKDTCSGVHSIFAALAVGAAYAVFRRYSLGRMLLVLTQFIFWVVLANALRVFAIVYAQSRFGIDLSSGTIHEVLGLLTFALGAGLALSGDHFLRYLVPLKASVDFEWPDYLGEVRERAWFDHAISPWVGALAVAVVTIVCGGCAIAFYHYQPAEHRRLTMQEMAELTYLDLEQVTAATLPTELGDWRQTGFAREDRTKDSLFGGMVSYSWQYTSPTGRHVLVSLDGPYDGWHNLSLCYRASGWKITARDRTPTNASIASGGVAARIAMEQEPSTRADVLFYYVAPDGSGVAPPRWFADGTTALLPRFVIAARDDEAPVLGGLHMQLMDQRFGEIPEGQKQENEALFWLAVEAFLERGRGDLL